MCGKYSVTKASEFARDQRWILKMTEFVPNAHARPTDSLPIILNTENSVVQLGRWGLIPSWASGSWNGQPFRHARAETIAEKPAFKNLLRKQRCLIIADGFFESKKEDKKKPKTQFYFSMRDGNAHALAGLWDQWQDDTGKLVTSFTIITTEANELMAPIHDRMPAIVPREGYLDWLDAEDRDPANLTDWLNPYPANEMEMHEVTRAVKRSKDAGSFLFDKSPNCPDPVPTILRNL